ncbi:MAG: nuclear transport factor 2 family protein [Dokdonella sp.]
MGKVIIRRLKKSLRPNCFLNLPRTTMLIFLRIAASAVVVMLTLSATVAIATTPESDLKKIFENRYAAMDVAMEARDSKAISAFLAPGFQSIDVDGTVENVEQMLKDVMAIPADAARVCETTVLSAERDANVATVVQRYHMTTTAPSSDGSDNTRVELTAVSTDTWIKSDGAWLSQKTRTEEMEYKKDGKVLLHRQRKLQP